MWDYIVPLLAATAALLFNAVRQFFQGQRRRAAANAVRAAVFGLDAAIVYLAFREFGSDALRTWMYIAGGAVMSIMVERALGRWLRAPAAPLRSIPEPDHSLHLLADEIRTPDADSGGLFGHSKDWRPGQLASRRIVLGSGPQGRFHRLGGDSISGQSDRVEVHFVLYDTASTAAEHETLVSAGTLKLLQKSGIDVRFSGELLESPTRNVMLTRWRWSGGKSGSPICYQASLSQGRVLATVSGASADTVSQIAMQLRRNLVDVSQGATPL